MILEYIAAEGGLALLDVNPGLAIWTTITFLLVFLILKVFAWGPISQALDARAERIHGDIERADKLAKDAEAKLQEYLSKLDGLRTEADDILREARQDGEARKEELIAVARKETESLKEQGRREVELARDKALEEIHREVVTLSVAIAQELIGKSMNADEHKRLIAESIQKLRSLN